MKEFFKALGVCIFGLVCFLGVIGMMEQGHRCREAGGEMIENVHGRYVCVQAVP